MSDKLVTELYSQIKAVADGVDAAETAAQTRLATVTRQVAAVTSLDANSLPTVPSPNGGPGARIDAMVCGHNVRLTTFLSTLETIQGKLDDAKKMVENYGASMTDPRVRRENEYTYITAVIEALRKQRNTAVERNKAVTEAYEKDVVPRLEAMGICNN